MALFMVPELQKSIYTTVLVCTWLEALGPSCGGLPDMQLSYKLLQSLVLELR